MQIFKKLQNNVEVVLYTVFTILLIVITAGVTINYRFNYSEKEAFEKLKVETEQLRSEISLQIVSDMENLETMASFAEKLYADGYGYELLFESFEEIGLFQNIGILFPDNTMQTKGKVLDIGNLIDFEAEAAKGKYISGRVNDLIAENETIVRGAVPIRLENGETVGILYGVINPKKLEERYIEQVESHNAYFIIVENTDGNFIVDSKQYVPGNISEFEKLEYKEGNNYADLKNDIQSKKRGNSVFKSRDGKEFMYVCYAPLDFANWSILLAHPENLVFDGAKETVNFSVLICTIIVSILVIYILLMFASLGRNMRINSCAADIRKNLLEVNKSNDSLIKALKIATEYARARSAFVIDPYSDECHYIVPELEEDQLLKHEAEYFNQKLLTYVSRHRTEHGAKVYFAKVYCDKSLREEMPDMYAFVVKHKMEVIYLSVVVNDNSTYVVGIINPVRKSAEDILKKTAVCFSMALYTKGHIEQWETMALTDSLTNAANRMAYNHEVKNMQMQKERYICVYIDVNELHVINNVYGHAAGDEMLIFVANALKEEFFGYPVYRMGGDEFLIFCKNIDISEVEKKIEIVTKKVEGKKYHISVGITQSSESMSVDDMVNAAEQIMYDNKLKYYEKKGESTARVPRKRTE